MNRDVCEHFNPVDLPCAKCEEKRKSEALFLADELEIPLGTVIQSEVCRRAAKELRRLYAELERCKQVCAATSEAWREEAALGCDHCNSPLYAAVKCRVCGRVTSAEPVAPPEAQTEAEKTAYCAGWWAALEKARKVEPVQEPVWVCPDSAEHRYQKPGHCEDCGKTLVQVTEPIECDPQYANDDGWCEWVCPQPRGYLMQCCDCGLIHEVDSRVAKYQPRPSEEFEVVDDPDLQVQWRMKRRDDISPKRKPLTEDEIALIVANCSASAHRHDDFSFARAIERAHGIGGAA